MPKGGGKRTLEVPLAWPRVFPQHEAACGPDQAARLGIVLPWLVENGLGFRLEGETLEDRLEDRLRLAQWNLRSERTGGRRPSGDSNRVAPDAIDLSIFQQGVGASVVSERRASKIQVTKARERWHECRESVELTAKNNSFRCAAAEKLSDTATKNIIDRRRSRYERMPPPMTTQLITYRTEPSIRLASPEPREFAPYS